MFAVFVVVSAIVDGKGHFFLLNFLAKLARLRKRDRENVLRQSSLPET